jgi:outer membrane protein assembly factor BamE (lipoprotein component of BamABCDE complex)
MSVDRVSFNRIKRSAFRIMTLALVVSAAASCSNRLSVHGSILDQQKLSEVKAGQMTRQEVQEILGSPSSKAVFDQESWYYISSKTSSFAFFEPKVLERKVVIVRFDDKGVVKKVENLDLKDGRNVQIVERTTPTKGKEFTLIEQVVGNVGRFTGGLNKQAQ